HQGRCAPGVGTRVVLLYDILEVGAATGLAADHVNAVGGGRCKHPLPWRGHVGKAVPRIRFAVIGFDGRNGADADDRTSSGVDEPIATQGDGKSASCRRQRTHGRPRVRGWIVSLDGRQVRNVIVAADRVKTSVQADGAANGAPGRRHRRTLAPYVAL